MFSWLARRLTAIRQAGVWSLALSHSSHPCMAIPENSPAGILSRLNIQVFMRLCYARNIDTTSVVFKHMQSRTVAGNSPSLQAPG